MEKNQTKSSVLDVVQGAGLPLGAPWPRLYLAPLAHVEVAERSIPTLTCLKLVDGQALTALPLATLPGDATGYWQQTLAPLGGWQTRFLAPLRRQRSYQQLIALVAQPLFVAIQYQAGQPLTVIGLDQPLTLTFDKTDRHELERLWLQGRTREGHRGYQLDAAWLPSLLGQAPQIDPQPSLSLNGAFAHQLTLTGQWLATVEQVWFGAEVLPIISQTPTELVVQLPAGRKARYPLHVTNGVGKTRTPFKLLRY